MSIPPLLAGSLLAALLIADAGAAEYTAEAYKTAVGPCMRARDYDCAEKNWMQYLRLRPNDGNALANLGIVRNLRDDHKGAVVALERAIDLGEGTYDLFSYYADSLAKLGRTDDAINWSYKALAVVPKLVDVRGNLAKLLVLQKRYYEALSLLESFDADLQAKGQQPYFEGQRISIETALSRNEPAPSERAALRLPKHGDHFFVPVTIGDIRPEAFLIDTGASKTVMDEELLARSKVNYKLIQNNVMMRTADGRTVRGKAVSVESMKVGPYELKASTVVTCKGCVPLLGQSALSRFDLKSSKMQGVEFLSLALRH
jgi:predicted aspartyl protease